MESQQLLLLRVLIVDLKKELLELAMSVSDESEIHTRESLFNKLMKKVESCNEIEEISSEKWSSSGLGNKKSAQNIWNS
ncbi:hypothetical protein [Paenibacillus sp. FSL K6-1230]|uniref:hypothetical protein n=1 Tax=Paenibacillus sp. FSL K6-1230 TaxID=2921603 RepID=UPI0030F64B57